MEPTEKSKSFGERIKAVFTSIYFYAILLLAAGVIVYLVLMKDIQTSDEELQEIDLSRFTMPKPNSSQVNDTLNLNEKQQKFFTEWMALFGRLKAFAVVLKDILPAEHVVNYYFFKEDLKNFIIPETLKILKDMKKVTDEFEDWDNKIPDFARKLQNETTKIHEISFKLFKDIGLKKQPSEIKENIEKLKQILEVKDSVFNKHLNLTEDQIKRMILEGPFSTE